MFFKCLDCESSVLDPDLNTWQCPVCGSTNFVIEEKQTSSATPRRSNPVLPQVVEGEKVTAL